MACVPDVVYDHAYCVGARILVYPMFLNSLANVLATTRIDSTRCCRFCSIVWRIVSCCVNIVCSAAPGSSALSISLGYALQVT